MFLFGKVFQKKHEKPLQSDNRFVFENQAVTRFCGNLVLLAFIFSVAVIIMTLKDNLIDKKIKNMTADVYRFSAEHGFQIDDIVIEGRYKTSVEELNEIINLNRKDSVLEVDLPELQEKIETLPWVKKAEVKRSYFPNVLYIYLEEKKVAALYQSGHQFFPLDENGKIIPTEFTPEKNYLVVVGKGAPEKLKELLEVTSSVPELNKRIVGAVLYAERRWNIIFDDLENGIVVKFAEENLERSWKKLIKINNKYGILKRKLTFIDLRYPDKVTVGLTD